MTGADGGARAGGGPLAGVSSITVGLGGGGPLPRAGTGGVTISASFLTSSIIAGLGGGGPLPRAGTGGAFITSDSSFTS